MPPTQQLEGITADQWVAVEAEVRRFIRKYPLHWSFFRKDLAANQSTYQLAVEGDLKESGFRNTLSFPVVARRRTEQEIADDPAHGPTEFVESLKDNIEKIIPGFTQPDTQDRPNRAYKEFLRRYGSLFRPGERY